MFCVPCYVFHVLYFMKKSELVFNVLQLPVDFLMITIAGLAAYFLRFHPGLVGLRPVVFNLSLEQYLGLVIFIAPVFIITFALIGLYSFHTVRHFWREIPQIIIGVSAGFMVVIFTAFMYQELFSSRFIFIAAWILAVIFIILGRFLVRNLQKWAVGKYQFGIHRLIILGGNGAARAIAKGIKKDPGSGYRLIRKLKNFSIKELKNIAEDSGVDEIILCSTETEKEKVLDLLDFCQDRHIDFKFIPNLFQSQAAHLEMRTFNGVPLVELKRTPLDGWGKVIKRAIDIFGSAFGLIILSPFFLILALAVKLDSAGPVFAKLKRISRGKVFYLYKFRSMIKNAEELKKDLLQYNERTGPLFKMKNDPRVTKIGKFIRRTRIDEFAQLINVLKGEMSLVGPRPHELEEVAQYEKRHKKLLMIKPGITGLAQVSGSSDLDFEKEVKLDTYYIENWSLFLDIQILFKTLIVFIKGDRAAC